MGLFDEKTEGQKSRDNVPLNYVGLCTKTQRVVVVSVDHVLIYSTVCFIPVTDIFTKLFCFCCA
jgi:hypothetical protein